MDFAKGAKGHSRVQAAGSMAWAVRVPLVTALAMPLIVPSVGPVGGPVGGAIGGFHWGVLLVGSIGGATGEWH